MTEDGFDRVMAFATGVWPTAEISEETNHVWRLKLDRFTDDQVLSVVFALAESERFLPALSQVYQACVDAGNRAAAQLEPTQRRELTPFGSDHTNPHDRRWNALPEDEQQAWLAKARAAWPDWLRMTVKPGAPLVAHAAWLERCENGQRRLELTP